MLTTTTAPPLRLQTLVKQASIGDTRQTINKCQLAQEIKLKLERQMGTDTATQGGGIDGFIDKIDSPRIPAGIFIFSLTIGCHKDDRNITGFGALLEATADFEPIHARHLDI